MTEDTAATRRCPICGKPTVAEHRPFCSRRCAIIDLGRWLKEDYRIPAAENPEATAEDDPEA
jgi:endogenous inhibitor of DNA gyrase (YacG/DUF329 family)